MPGKSTPPRHARRDHRPRNVQPRQHDPHAPRRERSGAVECDRCGVVRHAGRWYWGKPPLCQVRGGLCPACRRIEARYPAGLLRLNHLPPELRAEVLALVRNVEAREREEHPLERLMTIDETRDPIVVTTTGLHIARRIADALRRRAHGGVSLRYAPEGNFLEVDWTPR